MTAAADFYLAPVWGLAAAAVARNEKRVAAIKTRFKINKRWARNDAHGGHGCAQRFRPEVGRRCVSRGRCGGGGGGRPNLFFLRERPQKKNNKINTEKRRGRRLFIQRSRSQRNRHQQRRRRRRRRRRRLRLRRRWQRRRRRRRRRLGKTRRPID